MMGLSFFFVLTRFHPTGPRLDADVNVTRNPIAHVRLIPRKNLLRVYGNELVP